MEQPVADVLHIRHAGPHVCILHAGKHGGELPGGLLHRIFRTGPPRADDAHHGIPVIPIVQHHLVNEENLSALGANLPAGGFSQVLQLPPCFIARLLGAAQLGFRIGRLRERNVTRVMPQQVHMPHRHTA